MTRRRLLSLLTAAQAKASEPCPVNVTIEAGPSVRVTVPNIRKKDLVDLTSTFLGREHPDATKKLAELLRSTNDVTLVMTTKKCG